MISKRRQIATLCARMCYRLNVLASTSADGEVNLGDAIVGVYSEYLDRKLDFEGLTAERKEQLKRIAQIRGRDVLVYAADLSKKAPVSITFEDILPIKDQLSNLRGDRLDLIIETPGGSGEVAEDIVKMLRQKYNDVAVIVPGWAKSAGTIITMAADEILMEPSSALGPIDAQMTWQGKTFSAHALLEGLKKIQQEADDNSKLNLAYIPILQAISPGELQHAKNALDFAKTLVTSWLIKYKFKDWNIHSSTGGSVTSEEKQIRAEEIANKLCDHRIWLTHGKSIHIEDLRSMKLKITDYTESADLFDAINRYYTLLKMTFDTNIYKVFETPDSQIFRVVAPNNSTQQVKQPEKVNINFDCSKCKAHYEIQVNLDQSHPLEEGKIPYPKNNKFKCLNCSTEHDLTGIRLQIEAQTKKRVVA